MKEKPQDAQTIRLKTLEEIGETALANFEDLAELSSQGGPETNAAYQALQLVTWLAMLAERQQPSAEKSETLERRVPGLTETDARQQEKAIRKWVSEEATPQEMLALLVEFVALRVIDTSDPALAPIRENILECFTDAGLKGFEEKTRERNAAKGKEKKTPALDVTQEDAAAAEAPPAAEPPEQPPEETDIAALGLTVQQLSAAYVGPKWSKIVKNPETVKTVTLAGRKFVCLGSAAGGGNPTTWTLAPLYPLSESCNRFPGIETRLNPGALPGMTGEEAGKNHYFGVRVKVGKEEFVIGPPEEERKVSQPASEGETSHAH